jgi:predicted acetyltransferase
MEEFVWLDPGELKDGDLTLVLREKFPADSEKGYVPAYKFDMRRDGEPDRVGTIDLRISESDELRRYAGNVGYEVYPSFRGHRYAARACRLLFPLARLHGIRELWITCNPDNHASARTCETLGAVFVDTVDLPKENEMYQRGERAKRRYRLGL